MSFTVESENQGCGGGGGGNDCLWWCFKVSLRATCKIQSICVCVYICIFLSVYRGLYVCMEVCSCICLYMNVFANIESYSHWLHTYIHTSVFVFVFVYPAQQLDNWETWSSNVLGLPGRHDIFVFCSNNAGPPYFHKFINFTYLCAIILYFDWLLKIKLLIASSALKKKLRFLVEVMISLIKQPCLQTSVLTHQNFLLFVYFQFLYGHNRIHKVWRGELWQTLIYNIQRRTI